MLNRLIQQLTYNVKYGLGPKEKLSEKIKRANSNMVLARGRRRDLELNKLGKQS